VVTGSREENASKQESTRSDFQSERVSLMLMMNGETVAAAASAAMTSPPNQLEFP
jgi:hypothetical protein